tara:strand:- start:257 stop:466 length:210 start_codon:yes stop_codon:yes gene_type:complete
MNDYWYLCGRTGIIKYAGKFEDYDDADEGIRQINIDCIWIFSECPEVENRDNEGTARIADPRYREDRSY